MRSRHLIVEQTVTGLTDNDLKNQVSLASAKHVHVTVGTCEHAT